MQCRVTAPAGTELDTTVMLTMSPWNMRCACEILGVDHEPVRICDEIYLWNCATDTYWVVPYPPWRSVCARGICDEIYLGVHYVEFWG